MTIYKKQLRKALSRGLRGKTNNVPGFYGRVFHRIGVDAAKGEFDTDYCSFHKFDTLDELGIAIEYGDTYFVLDLAAFFYGLEYLKESLK
jgi:hypothetical protein